MTTTGTALPLPTEDGQACCGPLTAGVLGRETAQRLARVFKALGDPTRLRLLSMVAAHEGGEACICELTTPVGLTQGTVSHHMRQLVDAGLLTREQRGKWAYYRIVEDTLEALRDSLRTPA